MNSGLTIIVGSTVISTSGATPATNVTGGTLLVDTTAGPSPGPISIQSVNGNALQANGGTILVTNGVNVQTAGGHALLANGASSVITIGNGASITTTGVGAALAAIGGTINATGVVVNNTGIPGAGHGAIAESGGTINLHAGTSITTSAFNSVGLGASGAGSRVVPDVLIPVTMNGRGAMGVYLHDGGQVALLPGSTLQMNGTSSVGVAVDNTVVALGNIGSGLTINLNAAGVAGQAGSTGVVALNGASIALNNLTVTGSNAAAGVWAQPGTSITLTGASVININAEQNPTFYTLQTANLVTFNGPVSSSFSATSAIPNSGLFAPGGTITSVGTTINVTSGNGSAGAYTGFNGVIDMTNNTITTTGANSFGIRVDSGQVTARDSSITTSGGGAALFYNFGPGVIDLTNTAVLATGVNTSGLFSLNGTAASTNVFRMSGGSLISTQDIAVGAQGPLSVTTTNGAVVTGGQFLLVAFNQSGAFPQPTVVQFDASGGSVLTGDALAESLAIANINLTTGSQWTGAAFDVTNVSVDSTSTWTVTANSTVTQQVTNAGLVQFATPASIADFKTLTAGSYVGGGGVLGLNTFLGTDGSPSDKLIINGGAATGDTRLRVTNFQGSGALTTSNGILVVDTINGGSTATSAFRLGAPVVAGPYAYNLFRGSVDASNPQAWYLRSTIDCSQPGAPSPPCSGPGPNPGPPGPTPEPPNYRTEVSLYAAIPAMTLLYGRAIIDTLHERVGEEEDVRGRANPQYNSWPTGAWARAIGLHGRRQSDTIFGSGPTYGYDFLGFQTGQDFYRYERPDGIRDHAGLYLAFGSARGDVSHFDGSGGKSNFYGYSIGGYWTRFGPSGWYVDAVLQGTWYDVSSTANRGVNALVTTGRGIAGSLEAGYPFRLGNGFFIEPQAQVVYQKVDLADASDVANTIVRFGNVDSIAGRVGVRFGRTWALDSGLRPRQVTAWFRPNLWHEFRGNPRTEFSSADGFVPFRADLGGSWLELNAGASGQISEGLSLFGNVGYQTRFEGVSYSYTGKFGLRKVW